MNGATIRNIVFDFIKQVFDTRVTMHSWSVVCLFWEGATYILPGFCLWVFFVLRKKNNQITFLHLIHHATMVPLIFYTCAYHFDETLIIYATMNSFVHVIMYFYYFLASLGPSIQRYLWWKSHLTKIQIVQFVILITHLALMKLRGCRVSTFIAMMWVLFTVLIMALFLNFYIRAYIKKKSAKKA